LYSYGRGVVGYWAWPYYSQSINLTITCLQHFFNTVLEKEEDLPPVLFLQMDNAAKDNKNVVSSEPVQLVFSRRVHQSPHIIGWQPILSTEYYICYVEPRLPTCPPTMATDRNEF
jgi:hypothetical protein